MRYEQVLPARVTEVQEQLLNNLWLETSHTPLGDLGSLIVAERLGWNLIISMMEMVANTWMFTGVLYDRAPDDFKLLMGEKAVSSVVSGSLGEIRDIWESREKL